MNFFQRLFGRRVPPPKAREPYTPAPGVVEAARRQLESFARPAYRPVLVEETPSFDAASKLGGYPYLRHEDDWPRCPHCGKQMPLFLQLDRQQVPPSAQPGLVQLFYCTNEDEGYEPFSDTHVRRLIFPEGPSAAIEPDLPEHFAQRRISGWKRENDYPHYNEHEELGLNFDYDLLNYLETEGIGQTLTGDKLYGWPYWVQNEEYPFDKNGARMELLFQIDSEKGLDFLFGDCGIAHLTQSPTDPSELAFGWACS